MKVTRRLRPSPAIVVACIALLLAMTGTGYAVTRLPRNNAGIPSDHAFYVAVLG
jgi:hypothetical protein